MNKEGVETFELTGTWPELGIVPLSIVANHPAIAKAWAASIAMARNKAIEEAARIADARAAVCREAQHLGPETLPSVEIHTALEAEHIASSIRALKNDNG